MIILGKGELAEESLRSYFLKQGYFVVRSLPFSYAQTDITDIDLLLYRKNSPFTRERVNVDIKNKSNPKAFERIIWAKGVQNCLKLEKSFIATTSKRKEVSEFGLMNDVTVIDGNFLNQLTNIKQDSRRVFEEQFISQISSESCGESASNWKKRFLSSKKRLINKLNFSGCNEYLREINYFLGESTIQASATVIPFRMLYLNIAFFLICLDFLAKTFITLDKASRIEHLINGFNYGERGKDSTENIAHATVKLVSSVIEDENIAKALLFEIDKQIRDRPVEILVDFFCESSNLNQLFENAKQFEAFAYSQEIITPAKLPIELQSILGLLADFSQISRKRILI